MSEHMSIKGPIDFYHLPYGEEGSFSYCHRCKIALGVLNLELNQGWLGDWIRAICPKCRKTIWVAHLTTDYNKNSKDNKCPKKFKVLGDNGRVLINDNKKCTICKKPTNHYDASGISVRLGSKSEDYLCSEKCLKEYHKRLEKKYKKRIGKNNDRRKC